MQAFASFARKSTLVANNGQVHQLQGGYTSVPSAATEAAYLQAHKRLAEAQNMALELQNTSSSSSQMSFARERTRLGSENLQSSQQQRGMPEAMATQETLGVNTNRRFNQAATNVVNLGRAIDSMRKSQDTSQGQSSSNDYNNMMNVEQQQFQQPRLNQVPSTKPRGQRYTRKPNRSKQDNSNSNEDLKLFLTQLQAMIQENSALLVHPDELKESVTQELDEEQVHDKRKRNYLKEMLKNQISNRKQFAMPMWRHIAAGNPNPPPELVMKGISLFKCAANIIIAFVVRPRLSVRNKQAKIRQAETQSLMKSLKLYIDPTTNWLGKVVKIPLQTIVQDKTIDFSKAFDINKSSYQRNTSVTQLKVRLRAIIDNLTQEMHPPEHIMGLLQTIVADGNHFDPDFLYDCEKERLEVNEAGATRNTFEVVPEDELLSNKETFLDPQKYLTVDDTCFRVEQGRMLLLNIVFIRLLINHVVLTPWNCAICQRPPGKHIKNVVRNLRIVASLLYLSARTLDPLLPTIQVQEVVIEDETETKEKEDRKEADAALAAVVAGDEVGIDVKEEVGNGEKLKKEDKRDIIKEAITWFSHKLSLSDMRGTVVNEEHCETSLLGEKVIGFDSMQDFQNFLLPVEYFVSEDKNKALFESICKDLRSRLNRWLTKLSLTILHYRILEEEKINEEEETSSRPATVMSALKSNRGATSRKDGERVNSASPVRIAREGQRSRAGSDNIRVKESARV